MWRFDSLTLIQNVINFPVGKIFPVRQLQIAEVNIEGQMEMLCSEENQ